MCNEMRETAILPWFGASKSTNQAEPFHPTTKQTPSARMSPTWPCPPASKHRKTCFLLSSFLEILTLSSHHIASQHNTISAQPAETLRCITALCPSLPHNSILSLRPQMRIAPQTNPTNPWKCSKCSICTNGR